MKIAKIEISKWASVFSLVYVITKLGKKIILASVKILMGGNRLENLQFLAFFGILGYFLTLYKIMALSLKYANLCFDHKSKVEGDEI